MGASGRDILEALIGGETDPERLLTLLRRGVKAPAERVKAALLAMGRSLDMDVIAEAVETEQQLEILRRHHCSEVQGFLLDVQFPLTHSVSS